MDQLGHLASSSHAPAAGTLRPSLNALARGLCALVLVFAVAPAAAQTDCASDPACVPPPSGEGKPLQEPDVIRSRGGELDTELEVKYFTNVPVGDAKLNLRMYGYPDPDDGKIKYTLPGPTYRIRKGEMGVPEGDVFKLKLTNSIAGTPTSPDDACNPVTPPVTPPEVYPNCFHGNDVTNFHFHGFHISPKRIDQNHFYDYIFLALNPRGTPCDEGATDCVEGTAHLTTGTLPPDQAAGTHWYHPHHHGATALQVMNGMAGAFLVEGEFDAELEDFYGGELDEKVLVLQQVVDEIPFPSRIKAGSIQTLVNGQLNPQLRIGKGEIERWRIVNAAASLRSHTEYTFPPGYEVRQIAMDGVQFAPANYRDQPLLEGDLHEGYKFTLAAGNRADFLVKGAGTAEEILHEPAEPNLLEKLVRPKVLRGQILPLFSVTADPEDDRRPEQEMRFPTFDEWRKRFPLPPYLANVERSEISRERCIVFSMDGTIDDKGRYEDVIRFFIDGKKFNGSCVDQRMVLDSAEEWSFLNEKSPNPTQGAIPHPAHIHVNPFQVWVRDGVSHVDKVNPYPIWQDTIALSTDPKKLTVIRSRFETFDGRFVMHCHILGHEDRGMMQQLEVGDGSGFPLCRPYHADTRCEDHLAGDRSAE